MYAVVQVSRFALQAALRFEPSDEGREADERPVALVDAEAKTRVVMEATEAAEREGVVVGLSIPKALARCEKLAVLYRSPQAEAALEDLLFGLAYTLSPRVEREAPGAMLVDLRGVTEEDALARGGRIVSELAGLGIRASVGMAASSVVAALAAGEAAGVALVVEGKAETAGGAAARREETAGAGVAVERVAREAFLEALPVGLAGAEAATLDVLGKWGVGTIGAFARLRRSAVGARLGVEGLRLWDRVTGREERVVGVAALPPEFEESWEFEYDVDSLDPLLFLLRRFLDTLAVRMRAAGKVAIRMRVELGLAYGEPMALEQKLPEPTSDAEALFRLLAGRMEGLEAESPVARLALRLEVADFEERQLGLFESSLRNPYRFTQTLSRVAGIVGAERVGRPVLEADGRPDGFRLEAMPASVPPAVELSLERCFGMPLRRFRPGRPAAVELQGRQPIWIQCEGVSGFVKAVRGPWLHSGHWWETDGSWNRVEWDVELRKGGVYRVGKDEDGWKVEGVY